MKLDILVLAAHPDDAEISCGGTIARHVSFGHKVGIVDLTRGELGTRGTPEIREVEASNASQILKVSVRENIGLRDGFFQKTETEKIKVVEAIRKFKPEIILANAIYDRHPDHGRASELIEECCFLSGLVKVVTKENGSTQAAWKPKVVYHFIQSQYIKPDLVVDVSDFWETKMESLRAFKSQFYDPNSKEPDTFISNPGFMKLIESRGQELGYSIGVKYGEGFTVSRNIGTRNLLDLL